MKRLDKLCAKSLASEADSYIEMVDEFNGDENEMQRLGAIREYLVKVQRTFRELSTEEF